MGGKKKWERKKNHISVIKIIKHFYFRLLVVYFLKLFILLFFNSWYVMKCKNENECQNEWKFSYKPHVNRNISIKVMNLNLCH